MTGRGPGYLGSARGTIPKDCSQVLGAPPQRLPRLKLASCFSAPSPGRRSLRSDRYPLAMLRAGSRIGTACAKNETKCGVRGLSGEQGTIYYKVSTPLVPGEISFSCRRAFFCSTQALLQSHAQHTDRTVKFFCCKYRSSKIPLFPRNRFPGRSANERFSPPEFQLGLTLSPQKALSFHHPLSVLCWNLLLFSPLPPASVCACDTPH